MPVKLDAVKEKLSALGKKAKGLASFLLGPQDVLAVDLGTYAIKCVWIKQEGNKGHLKTWAYIPYKLKPDATPDEKKAEAIKELKAFLIQKGIKIQEAATSLSGNSVIVRYVKFPQLTKAELNSTLATEA